MNASSRSDDPLRASERIAPAGGVPGAERGVAAGPGLGRDVPELETQSRALQEVQNALESSVNRYVDFYDHLPLACVTVSAGGEVRAANRVATELLGCAGALAGVRLDQYLDADDAGRFARHLESSLASGRTGAIELTIRRAGGEAVAVQFSSRRAPNGAESQVHIAITDLSQLKQAQRILEDINLEQEAFNTSISHDLRSPLVTIDNYAGILLTERADALDDEGKRMLGRIRAAAQRLETTLKRLLDYSALAHEEVVLGPVGVEALVTELLIEHRRAIEEKNAEILVDRPLPSVRASRPILRQALTNVLVNALRYTLPDEPPQVRIFAESTDQTVVIKVRDQGIGIDPKHHERVFRVFERLHGYSRYPGSGVGLAIARRAMDRMHGRIWVESEAGQGSCFCLELPRG